MSNNPADHRWHSEREREAIEIEKRKAAHQRSGYERRDREIVSCAVCGIQRRPQPWDVGCPHCALLACVKRLNELMGSNEK